MKSLEELIAEIRREALGEDSPPSGPAPGGRSPVEAPGRRRGAPRDGGLLSEEDFDLELDVDLEVPHQEASARDAPSPAREAPGDPEEAQKVVTPASPAPRPPEPPADGTGSVGARRVGKVRRRRVARGLRWLALAALAAAVGAGAVVGLEMLRDDPLDPVEGAKPIAPLADQDVATWAISDPELPDDALVTVLTGGGDLPPVAVGIPAYTVVNIPGYGLATVGDAAALHDPGLVAAAVENLIGVRVDVWEVSDLDGLAAVIDRLGGIAAGDRTMRGSAAIRYLIRGDDDVSSAELRFLRWQEVTDGILRASAGRSELLAGVLPPGVAAVVGAAGTGGAEVLELPVSDIGSGLASPDADAVQALVSEWFVPTSKTGRTVRLVVMNGVGTPGIGERVARVLVPSGFQLVSSVNAPSFDYRETQIIAETKEFLREADLARRLLGVGKVFQGETPTGVADVTVIVGSDFGGQ